MTVTEILSILFIHWVADFVCQTHWQATNKSTNIEALFEHVSIYTFIWAIVLIIVPIGCISLGITMLEIGWSPNLIWFPVITFIVHFFTDYLTSKLNKYLWDKKDVHNFFVSVGFDQWLHYVQLFITYKLLK